MVLSFFIATLSIGMLGNVYLIGRMHGYEKCEKHDRESKTFWEDVKKDGV